MIDPKKVFVGGTGSVSERYLAPTILRSVTWNDPVMQDEIFGPILPVLEFDQIDDVFSEIRKRDRPLAAYLFTQNQSDRQKFLELQFGGGCINDTVLHLTNGHAPFGGVGASGIGSYHGDKSFETFSHQKTIVMKSRFFDLSIRYPPYSKKKLSFLRWLME